MNEIYINISIIEYNNGKIDCMYTEQVNDEPMTIKPIDLDRARRLMWELVLAGGKKTVEINRYDRNIVRRDAYIILPN